MQKVQKRQLGPAQAWRRKSVEDLINHLGFLKNKSASIGGRVNPELLALARSKTGIESDSQLIELALGSLVVDDGFPDAFRKTKGTIDPNMDLDL